jgi:hypothetical protein
MEEETGKKDPTGLPDSTETDATGDQGAARDRRGPGWKGWVLSILVAIALSVTATLLLGGSAAFRSDRAVAGGTGGCGDGAGSGCCPPADAGK